MNRRKFLQFLGKSLVGATGLSLTNCGNEKQTFPNKRNINGLEYQLTDGVLSQITKGNDLLKLGIMTDLHAHKDNSRYFAEQLNKEGVDLFLVPGDLSHSFGDYEGAEDDYSEILSVIEPIADTGKLVLITNGNHEQRNAYRKALNKLSSQYQNVIDLENFPVVDLENLTIFAMGGNNDPGFNVPEGFLRTADDMRKLASLIEKYQTDKNTLIATHVPKKYSTKKGLDYTGKKRNVGWDYITILRNAMKSKFAVSGHIHEAYGIITPDEQPIKQGEFSEQLDFNPGAIYDHLKRQNLKPASGILEFKENKARAYILNR